MDWKGYRTGVDFGLEALKRLPDETHQLDLKFLKMLFWGMENLGEAGNSLHLDCLLRSMWRKHYRTGVDFGLQALKRLRDETHQLDLKFLKMLFWGMENLGEAGNSLHLDFILRSMWREFLHELEMFQAKAGGGEITDWELMSSPLLAFLVEKIEQLKPQVKESCTVFLGREQSASDWASCNKYFSFSTCAIETVYFIGLILENIDGVLNSKKVDDPIDRAAAAMQQQIGFVQGKLKLFRDFAYLALVWRDPPPPTVENLSKLLLHIRTWANHISCLACLFWIHFDEMDESLASTLATLLADLMHKTMPYSPEITSLYLDVLKYANHHKLPLGKHHLALHAARYVDFLLEKLVEVESLREGLIFLLAFVMDPPKVDSEDSGIIQAQTDAIISEIPPLIWSIHSDDTREGNSFFLEKIDRIKAQVKQAYVLITSSLLANSPRTNATGFLDFLVRNLKKMLEVKPNFISSVKIRLERIREELASLRPLLQKISRLQDEDEKFKDLCMRVISTMYYAEYCIKLSSIVDVSVWYIIICLSNVIEDIKLLKIEIENIEDGRIYHNKKITVKIPQATSLSSERAFVGFHEEERSIKDHLIGGRKDLTIISISGMAGQGKTTLAKRIYNTYSIQCRFQKTAWGYVSKGCEKRELLIRILWDANNTNDESILTLSFQDLAERVRKSFKGTKYLVVLDDIWDVDVWREVQASFPNDKNGSRIMFTSRNHDLVSQAKPYSISHRLRLFSKEESLELMKQKLFPYDGCPPELPEICKEIAAYCKGLPLAVSLIATLLGRKEKELDFWKEVAGQLKSHLASEGCTQVLELSYQYLPDHLKACFLYFGAFPRGKSIRATNLKLLWIAERFIAGDEMGCSQDLAEECLDNLVSQSLVVVTKRSSTGQIKTCNVHDLLYDLCLEKAVQENFLHLADKSDIRVHFFSENVEHYRICRLPLMGQVLSSKELPTGLVGSIICSGNFSWWLANYSILKSFKVVSVLDLDNLFLIGNEDFPEEILCMVHLRYLAIRVHNKCKNIPPSISSLWYLETLFLYKGNDDPITCPEAMLKMKSLRHIKVGEGGVRFAISSSSSSQLEETSNIETIDALIICNNSECKETFMRLPKLKKLTCYFGKRSHRWLGGWLSLLKSLHQLESLRMHGGYRETLYRFTGFDFLPQNLKKLRTYGIWMHWEAMPTIGKLPNLEVLRFEDNVSVGKRWDVGDGEFLRLRSLFLLGRVVEKINVSSCSDPFPSLETLVVVSCDKLEISSSFGDICTLKTIELIRSPKAARSARGILKQQREMGNTDLRVFIQESFYPDTTRYELDGDNDEEDCSDTRDEYYSDGDNDDEDCSDTGDEYYSDGDNDEEDCSDTGDEYCW